MAIYDWPLTERPREKLLRHGAETLSNAELLAILLREGTPGQSAVALAQTLLHHFGSLRALLNSTQTQICSKKGLGPAKFAYLKAALVLAQRYQAESLDHDRPVFDTHRAAALLMPRLRDLPHEVFYALFLDAKSRLIECEALFTGTLTHTTVHTRELIKRCLSHNAAGIILAHNHPSGIPEPSQEDRQSTNSLVLALKHIDVQLLDHIIIGENTAFSFLHNRRLR